MGWTILFKKPVATAILLIEGRHIAYRCKEEIKPVSTIYRCHRFVEIFVHGVPDFEGVSHYFRVKWCRMVTSGQNDDFDVLIDILTYVHEILMNERYINIGVITVKLHVKRIALKHFGSPLRLLSFDMCSKKIPLQHQIFSFIQLLT